MYPADTVLSECMENILCRNLIGLSLTHKSWEGNLAYVGCVFVGTIVGLLASGKTHEDILGLYLYLEAEDIYQALSYAAWRVMEVVPSNT